jgi:hypothetical protein
MRGQKITGGCPIPSLEEACAQFGYVGPLTQFRDCVDRSDW